MSDNAESSDETDIKIKQLAQLLYDIYDQQAKDHDDNISQDNIDEL